MNEYNYDYLGINGIIPNGAANFMNNVPNNMMNGSNMGFNPDNSMGINNNQVNDIDKNNILDPTKGFIRGNMFSNLYDQYKNYKPLNLDPKNERDAMLMSFQQYNFALTDLELYLDSYPNDRNTMNLYKQYLSIIDDIKKEYEKKYGPLTCSSMYTVNNNWKWNNSPWPWEVL